VKIKQHLLLIVVVAMAGCAFRPAMRRRPAGPTEATLAASETVNGHIDSSTESDDQRRIRDLEKAAGEMIDRRTATPVAKLIRQLDRGQCDLRLSKPSPSRMTPSQIYEQCKPSVLIVAGIYKCEKCGRWHPNAAGGFLITATGAFVTNYHVVNNDKNRILVAMTDNGKVFPVKEVLAASKANDVAILQLDAGGTTFQPLALSPEAPVGAPVSVISHPNRRFYTLTSGIVSRHLTQMRGGGKTTMMMITADFARGSSGGPVFNEYGAVMGFVESTMSLYYNTTDGKKDNLQMVFKQCVVAESVLRLVRQ
jgi:S1-C subfamily serine protease